MKDFSTEKIEVNDKHLVLRIVCFALAFVIAVVAFSRAVIGIGQKDPGYYDIETETVEDALLYAQGIRFTHYFDGESSEIKNELAAAKTAYSKALAEAYKLLNCENTYTDYVNLATINQSLGSDVELSDKLYAILMDAYAKTRENKGFNVFAGALNAAWEDILVLDDPTPFDPLNDPEEGERIARLARAASDASSFSLTVVDAERHIVRLDASKTYLSLIDELEADGRILDLGALHDAYMVALVRDAMEAEGFTNGFITCGGLTVSLSEHAAGAYCLYGYSGEVNIAARVPITGGSVCSELRAFGFTEDELGYYTVEQEGRTFFRHPSFKCTTGGFADKLLSSYVISTDGDIIGAVYNNIILNAADSPESITPPGDCIIAYTMQNDGKFLYTNAPTAVKTESGYTVR